MEQNQISGALLEEVEHHLAMLSHEFKTPLTVILSTLQLLEAKFKEDSAQSYTQDYAQLFEIATRNVYKTMRIAANVIEAGRIAKGCVTPNWEAIDMVALVEQLIEATQSYVQAHKAKITFRLQVPRPCVIYCDREMMDRILLNLISNAIKHLPAENGQIELALSGQGDMILVGVRDNGRGIPEEHIPYLFEKYWHTGRSGERDADGSGLGLYLARTLTLLHGGQIEVQSKQGRGSLFKVYLPRNQEKTVDLSASALAYESDAQYLQAHIEFSCLEQ